MKWRRNQFSFSVVPFHFCLSLSFKYDQQVEKPLTKVTWNTSEDNTLSNGRNFVSKYLKSPGEASVSGIYRLLGLLSSQFRNKAYIISLTMLLIISNIDQCRFKIKSKHLYILAVEKAGNIIFFKGVEQRLPWQTSVWEALTKLWH